MTLSLKSSSQHSLRCKALLAAVAPLAVAGDGCGDALVRHITIDSREVQPGSLFVAIRGYATDGHRFIGSAVERGAVAVICEELPPDIASSCLYLKVADARKALADTAKLFYRNVSDQLMLIGVTGTNGKTTTAKLITAMLNANGISAGYIGTNLCQIGEQHIQLERTTPEAHELHLLFSAMAEAGCKAVVMEVSSHALVLQRVYGLRFQSVIFTNLTLDHLDFHLSMEEYAAAKQLLFDQLAPEGFAVFNSDDPAAVQMAERVAPEKIYCCTLQRDYHSIHHSIPQCSHHVEADILASSISSSSVDLHFPKQIVPMQVGLPGRFNVMNVLEAATVGFGLGLAPEKISQSLAAISAVDGRMERVGDGSHGYSVFVDYAHTPDALYKALDTLRRLKPSTSRLVVVFGCGGNRDHAKRPEMGRIAAELADEVLVTSDNPRDENPETILDDIVSGITGTNYTRISNRAEAICHAVTLLQAGDVLLVAGKGHERYQEIAGKKYHFSDQEILRNSMQHKSAGISAKEHNCQ